MSHAKQTRLLARVVVPMLLVMVAGCGFHPRGQSLGAGNLGNVYVDAGGGVLGEELRLYLDDAGVSRAETAAIADVVVRLGRENFSSRVLTVDANTGKAREYELEYNVAYTARSRDGRTLVDNEQVTLTRDYVFDADALIGKSREQGELLEEMRRDAVQQILGRLDRVLGS